ncbi:uncharacterized protein MONOS_5762 [Monocercomonoides exilis]|uniref:uncharacterized protein n=1 Tax=Monocercomonoides exilis TaxID=2049356 RepID=UPI00355A7975|nr:hypothetical protein MONOS_5762 [Monocercomonoides exilis]|eukprot:MONOS_5762.1-p1 / transcript=MONOS_5762.1 / gene=MONOS_5762 / organism=Monocercomonoides_exilis_PA203 / gene_product=unspecified product / transcript_product=unspecified product / location=Mono_scaffold00172:74080-76383(+) / protein_length=600 / sequence_SO=supercontig / SO=protein_coding / is_pseudo=false
MSDSTAKTSTEDTLIQLENMLNLVILRITSAQSLKDLEQVEPFVQKLKHDNRIPPSLADQVKRVSSTLDRVKARLSPMDYVSLPLDDSLSVSNSFDASFTKTDDEMLQITRGILKGVRKSGDSSLMTVETALTILKKNLVSAQMSDRPDIVNTEMFTHLTNLIKHHPSTNIRKLVCSVLDEALSDNPEYLRQVFCPDLAEMLNIFISGSHETIQSDHLLPLSHFTSSRDQEIALQLINSGTIENLMRLVQHTDSTVVHFAIQSLFDLLNENGYVTRAEDKSQAKITKASDATIQNSASATSSTASSASASSLPSSESTTTHTSSNQLLSSYHTQNSNVARVESIGGMSVLKKVLSEVQRSDNQMIASWCLCVLLRSLPLRGEYGRLVRDIMDVVERMGLCKKQSEEEMSEKEEKSKEEKPGTENGQKKEDKKEENEEKSDDKHLDDSQLLSSSISSSSLTAKASSCAGNESVILNTLCCLCCVAGNKANHFRLFQTNAHVFASNCLSHPSSDIVAKALTLLCLLMEDGDSFNKSMIMSVISLQTLHQISLSDFKLSDHNSSSSSSTSPSSSAPAAAYTRNYFAPQCNILSAVLLAKLVS